MKHVVIFVIILICSVSYSQHETVKEYFENGQLKFEGSFKNGEKDGIHRWWYRDGQLEFEGVFKNGKKDGISKGWWENGALEYTGLFSYDKRDGLWEAYYENGQLRKSSNFLLQRKISEECFDETGSLMNCSEILESILWWKRDACFDEDGNLIDCNEVYFGVF